MTSMAWGKFFWRDWDSDLALRSCSLAAQGLWMRMLCIAAQSEPPGYLIVSGRALDGDSLARLISQDKAEVNRLLEELYAARVYSLRDETIYSRRMVSDYAKHLKAVRSGSQGGNPRLRNYSAKQRSVNHLDKAEVKPADNLVLSAEVKHRDQRQTEVVHESHDSDSQYGNSGRKPELVISKIATASLRAANSLDPIKARNGSVSVLVPETVDALNGIGVDNPTTQDTETLQ